MRYIGNKTKLLGWVFEHLTYQLDKLGISPEEATFLDGCTGTGTVAAHAAERGFRVIANDLLPFAAKAAEGRLCFPASRLEEARNLISEINSLPPEPGFFFQNYTAQGGRTYLTEENGQRVDAMRVFIRRVSDPVLQNYLWLCLLEAFSKVTNTTGTHAAFLKELAPNALVPLRLEPVQPVTGSGRHHAVYQGDIINLLPALGEETVLYLDPPYNTRQYAPNYHLYNTLVGPDPVIKGKTGLPEDAPSSEFCKSDPAEVASFFKRVLSATRARVVMISYSSDSTLSLDAMIPTLFQAFASRDDFRVEVQVKEYKRFRSADGDQPQREEPLYEYLVIGVDESQPTLDGLFGG